MFTLSVKDLAGGMSLIQTLSLQSAKEYLSHTYKKDVGCISLLDLSTGKELCDDVIYSDMECGVYVHSYSAEDQLTFEKFSYPSGENTVFFFDVYMNFSLSVPSIEKELFIIIHKLPELFEWIHDRNVTHFTLETYYITHEWYRDISNIHEIFDNIVTGIANNNTLVSLNLSIFYLYLYNHPEKRDKLQGMLNIHPTLERIYLTRHDQRNDKVVKLEKIEVENTENAVEHQ